MAQFWMSGVEAVYADDRDPYSFRFLSFAPLDRLMDVGLAYRDLEDGRFRYGYTGYYYDDPKGIDGISHLAGGVFTPETMCQWCDPLPAKPLDISPVEGRGGGMMRRPVEASMRMATLIEEARKLRKISVRQDGQLSQTVYNTLAKKVSWLSSLESDPILPLPDPTGFYIGLLLLSGVIVGSYPEAYVVPDVDELLDLPFDEQGRVWLGAYTKMAGWQETVNHRADYHLGGLDARMLPAMRQAILLAFSLLPQTDGWYRFSDFQEAVYHRLSGRLALSSESVRYNTSYTFRQVPERERSAVRVERTRNRWMAHELPWIREVLLGPLYQLGMVELQRESSNDPNSDWLFRTTPLLRRCVMLEAPESDSTAPAAAAPCWLVQPNFDVILYADRASARQVAFMNRIAQRASSEGPVLTFRLTRDSVYAGLESGLTQDAILAELQAGAERPVPDSVLRALRDWAARREQLQVIPNAALLEYSTAEERDAALSRGSVSGKPLGEQMIILDMEALPQARKLAGGVIDYLQEPPRCLIVKEPAEARVDMTRTDLHLRLSLPGFADPVEDGAWRISAESLQRAIKNGMNATSVLELLDRYASRKLPAVISYTLKAWENPHLGKRAIGLGNAIILTASDKALAEALASSSTLLPLLGARLGESAFAVDESKLEQLETSLRSLGFDPGKVVKR
jgi:hypothetical protein